MNLTLFQATLFFGLILLGAGLALLSNSRSVRALLRAFPRSRTAAYVTMGVGSAWALYKVTQLGQADFGDYKKLIFALFLSLAILSFKYSPDFLSVRGACIIILLAADLFLDAAFGHYETSLRLLMVGPVYALIALALFIAYAPYRVRDFFSWLFATASRPRSLGLILLAYGGLLSGVAFAY